MNVTVGVLWRAGDPWRERAWQYVHGYLVGCGHEPQIADSGHEPFNRAASRNQLVERAADADVVILHDADMLAPPSAYTHMAVMAARTGQMVVGFRHYRPLSKAATDRVLRGADPFLSDPVDVLTDFSVGGIIAITPAAWRRVGGMDERFVDWGCEDFEFANAAASTLGPVLRSPNVAVHLWHPHAGGHDHIDDNAALLVEGRTR